MTSNLDLHSQFNRALALICLAAPLGALVETSLANELSWLSCWGGLHGWPEVTG